MNHTEDNIRYIKSLLHSLSPNVSSYITFSKPGYMWIPPSNKVTDNQNYDKEEIADKILEFLIPL